MRLMTSLRGENEGYDQPVQRESLSENQDQNHTHKNLILLSVRTNTRVAHYTDG